MGRGAGGQCKQSLTQDLEKKKIYYIKYTSVDAWTSLIVGFGGVKRLPPPTKWEGGRREGGHQMPPAVDFPQVYCPPPSLAMTNGPPKRIETVEQRYVACL